LFDEDLLRGRLERGDARRRWDAWPDPVLPGDGGPGEPAGSTPRHPGRLV